MLPQIESDEMSRNGVEKKPPWCAVPPGVRAEVDRVLDGRVAAGNRAWGGYGPSPTFRLRLKDGRRFFLKAVSPDSNEFQRSAHDRELKVYSELKSLISPWAPAFITEFEASDWRIMLLEDLGPKSAPPWRASVVRRVATQFAEFHESTLGAKLPEWLRSTADAVGSRGIQWPLDRGDPSHRLLAAMAGEEAANATRWLATNSGVLGEAAAAYYAQNERECLLHLDVRSDNLRFMDGRLRLFDWPHVAAGGPEFDCVMFAQAVEVEGGPPAETVLEWYSNRLPLEPERVTGAIAVASGFFAFHSWQPEIPGLPRLRPFQVAQLRVTLRWAAERLGLTEPLWVDQAAAGLGFKF